MLQTLYPKHLLNVRDAFKKKNSEGDIGPFSFTPYPPSLNGTRGIETSKIVHQPPPLSSIRDKFHFSRGELTNPL